MHSNRSRYRSKFLLLSVTSHDSESSDDSKCIIWIYDWSSQLYTQLKQLWNWSLKKIFRPERDSNRWPPQYRRSATPTELSSHLEAGHFVSSQYTVKGEGCKWIYERSYIWTVRKDMNLWLIFVFIFQALISELLKLCVELRWKRGGGGARYWNYVLFRAKSSRFGPRHLRK